MAFTWQRILLAAIAIGLWAAGIVPVAYTVFLDLYRDFLCLRGRLPACGAGNGTTDVELVTYHLHRGHRYRYHKAIRSGKIIHWERSDV